MTDEARTCFVISPIGEQGSGVRQHADTVFRHIIEPAMEEYRFKAIRSDQLAEPGIISEQMFDHIIGDDLCVAVLTGYNPNVFYELAIAHAAKRPTILLIEKGHDLPFDLKDVRCVYYDFDPDAITDRAYVKQIIDHIRAFEAMGWKAHSPIDLLGRMKHLAQQKFFESFAEDDIVLVLSPHDVDSVVRSTAIHSFLGVLQLVEFLDNQGYRVRKERADRIGADALAEPLISVGGPIPNKVSRFLLEQSEIVYGFGDEDGHTIVSSRDPGFRIDPIRTGETVTRDFGILTRMKNPYDKERDAIVACGTFGWGTQAALRVLTDGQSLEYLARFGRHFQVICTCLVDEDQIATDAHLLDVIADSDVGRQTIVDLYRS